MADTQSVSGMSARCRNTSRYLRLVGQDSNTEPGRGSNSAISEENAGVNRMHCCWIMSKRQGSSTRSSISTQPTPGGSYTGCICPFCAWPYLTTYLAWWKWLGGMILPWLFPNATTSRRT